METLNNPMTAQPENNAARTPATPRKEKEAGFSTAAKVGVRAAAGVAAGIGAKIAADNIPVNDPDELNGKVIVDAAEDGAQGLNHTPAHTPAHHTPVSPVEEEEPFDVNEIKLEIEPEPTVPTEISPIPGEIEEVTPDDIIVEPEIDDILIDDPRGEVYVYDDDPTDGMPEYIPDEDIAPFDDDLAIEDPDEIEDLI